jgi:hypothetical protein
MTQFVAIRYAPTDKRTYTYANDGEPVAPGDFVSVPLRNNEPKAVEVVNVTDVEPPFACKGIFGKAEPPVGWRVPADESAK